MKKRLICLIGLATASLIVACGSGSSTHGVAGNLKLSFTPETCSVATNQLVTLSYSGVVVGESVTVNLAYKGTNISTQSTKFSFAESSLMMPCQTFALGSGVYTMSFSQNAETSSADLTVTP